MLANLIKKEKKAEEDKKKQLIGGRYEEDKSMPTSNSKNKLRTGKRYSVGNDPLTENQRKKLEDLHGDGSTTEKEAERQSKFKQLQEKHAPKPQKKKYIARAETVAFDKIPLKAGEALTKSVFSKQDLDDFAENKHLNPVRFGGDISPLQSKDIKALFKKRRAQLSEEVIPEEPND